MFTNTKAQLHVSAFNFGHLQVAHEKLIKKLYQCVWGVYSLWGEVGARSRFVLEKRAWTGAGPQSSRVHIYTQNIHITTQRI